MYMKTHFQMHSKKHNHFGQVPKLSTCNEIPALFQTVFGFSYHIVKRLLHLGIHYYRQYRVNLDF